MFKKGFLLKKSVQDKIWLFMSWTNTLTYWMKSPPLIMMQVIECKHVNSLMGKLLEHENWKSYFPRWKKENTTKSIKKMLSQEEKAIHQNDKRFKLRIWNAGWLFLLKHKKWKYLHNTKTPSNEIMGKSQVLE